MNTLSPEQKNAILDEILASRRSHRAFREEEPPETDIRNIIHAGLLAPYAAAAVGNSHDYFRRFFVMKKESLAMKVAAPLFLTEIGASVVKFRHAMEHDTLLKEQAKVFVQRLEMYQKKGMVPGVGTSPWFLVIAERRGFPPVEQQSLAHCLENMWLKATALGLGFQIVSVTGQMGENPDFCKILGISSGEWGLMGCAIGYPLKDLPKTSRPMVEEVTRWLD